MGIVQPYFIKHTYALGQAESLLQAKDSFLGSKLQTYPQDGSFMFNQNYSPDVTNDAISGGPVAKAMANEDPAKGLQVVDPISNAQFSIKPKFGLLAGKQDANRIVYPLQDGTGWVVYTMQATGVKEDVLLDHANGDVMTLPYEMDLDSNGLAARLRPDGSVAIYGSSSPVTGTVATGNSQDAALLQKARQRAPKDKYLFSLPAPVAYQAEHKVSSAKTHYELKGNVLTTVTTGLRHATFPLTVDPAVTVVSASDLFRDTNPESNVDFNGSTGNINRGIVTGGVFTSAWTANGNNLGTARFMQGAAVYDDYAYVAGGAAQGSTSNISTVEFAAMNKANSTIGTWATTTALPAALSRFQLIAYNGYMYAIGGSTTDTTCATDSANIYYNRIQNNGQLSATWTTNSVTLPSGTGLCGLGAAMYNDKLYIAGGRSSNTTASGVTTVAYATVNPNGSIGSFTSDDSTLPAARYDTDLHIYNGYAYIIGGTLAGTPTNSVLVGPLASDGSLYGGAGSATWDASSSFVNARTSMGASLASINDGYMYVEGGCQTLNGSQTCTSIRNDIEVAQINADGTIGNWSNVATTVASYSQVGGSLFVWRNTMYIFAGCSAMSSSTVSCTTALNTQQYDAISSPGQLGPLKTGTNMTVGAYLHGAAVVGGYLYVIGGCISTNATNGCQTGTADLTNLSYYAAISADGSIGSWTQDTHNIPVAIGAFGLAVYNNYIYIAGGFVYGSGASNKVYYVQTQSTGGFVSAGWQTNTNNLTISKYSMSAVVYRGHLMTFGGCSNTTTAGGCAAASYVATVDTGTINTANGSVGAFSTTTAMPTATAAMGGAVYNGYIYLAGGATNASAQTSTILYAKINDAGTITNWLGPTGTTTNNTNGTNGQMAHTLRRTDAYAMNGYLYVVGGHDASGNGGAGKTYPTIQIGKINLATGNIDNTLTDSVISITQRWDARAAFGNGYLYVTGGCSAGNPPAACTTASNVVEYVEIYNAGNKGTGTWTNASNVYTGNRTGAAATAYNGYIYVAGGCNSYTVATSVCAAAGNYLNDVQYAPLNPDGSIGTWASGGTLGASQMDSCMVAAGGYLYVIGGKNSAGTVVSTVYYSQIGTNGLPGTWNTATALTTALTGLSCATFNGRIYTTGGANTSGTAQTLVYYSPDMSAGGSVSGWTAMTGFTTARYFHTALIAGGYLYIMGGFTGSAFQMDVQFVALDPTNGGILSGQSWANTIDLPNAIEQQSAIVANGYIHLFGGRSASTTCQSTTWIAAVNSTGTISNWSQSVSPITTARFGAASAFYNGYYYVAGGDDCTNLISSNVIQFSGEKSQAMKGFFSKYADLAGDGNPEKLVIYLTNAQNNSVDIEKWRMKYMASREAANSWGVVTTVSPLITENAYNVSALDGAAADVVVSRWFWLSFDINMEQSFTFTDNTQPTIYQYGLHYSPPPTKRLMHGRDFRDQTQQGEDLNL